MKFMEGIIVGSLLTAGATILYNSNCMSSKKMMKKGKQIAKKMGIM